MGLERAPRPDVVVDTAGKFCPVPIIEIAKAIQAVGPGQVIELQATDPGVEADLQAWCKASRHEYLGLAREGDVLRAFVRKLK
jgi:tRNA 2-thiouridine synthesizing protein A